jgi:hypothetical protein
MNAVEALKQSMIMPEQVCNGYLQDMTDAELLVRPVEGANHIAWQLGHLIKSEHSMIEAICPGSMPPLPPGFEEKYTKQTAESNNPRDFLTKAEYLKLAQEQRAATKAVLSKLTDADLDKPVPEPLQRISKTVAGIFSMQPTHWMMHAGQWAVTRRRLGRRPLF